MAKYEWNNKAVNLLFAGLGTKEYQRVCHLETAREILAKLPEHHKGTTTVQAAGTNYCLDAGTCASSVVCSLDSR